MIRLNLSREPQVVDLGHGVTVTVRPLTGAIMATARFALQAAVAGLDDGPARQGAAQSAYVKSIARAAIIAWDGVEAEDGGPAVLTPDGIDALMDLSPLADAFEQKVVGAYLLMEAEKNASAPSPNGTSAGAPATAPAVVMHVASAPMPRRRRSAARGKSSGVS